MTRSPRHLPTSKVWKGRWRRQCQPPPQPKRRHHRQSAYPTKEDLPDTPPYSRHQCAERGRARQDHHQSECRRRGAFLAGLLGCPTDHATLQNLQQAKAAIEAALRTVAVVDGQARRGIARPLQLETTGLIIGYLASHDWQELVRIIGQRMPPAKDSKGVEDARRQPAQLCSR
ncbi:MAG: hypothetical protein U0Y68_23885 [Blastocatellia bacterium]